MRRQDRHRCQPTLRAAATLLILLAAGPLAAVDLMTATTLDQGNLYADTVARQRGDLITIQIMESVSISGTAKTERKRDNTLSATVTMVPGTNQLPAAEGSSSINHLPALKAGSSKDFKGEGSTQASDLVKAMITAKVVDVLDNGSLVVEGTREVTVNKDKKTILISGIVRPADIRSDNTVLSEKLNGFKVSIVGEGPLARSQDEGWLGRLADILWPF